MKTMPEGKTLPLKAASDGGTMNESDAANAGGDDGAYTRDIGTFLQQFHIYAADWLDVHTKRGKIN